MLILAPMVDAVRFDPALVSISNEEWDMLSSGVRAVISLLHRQNVELRQRVQALESRLKINSRNSSKPPSSDPPGTPKPPSQKSSSGKKSGAQPGHRGSFRSLADQSQVDEFVDHYPQRCGECHQDLSQDESRDSATLGSPERHQVFEIPRVAAKLWEHRLHTLTCAHCGVATKAELPPDISKNSFGPRLQALTAILTGRYHLSRRAVQNFLEQVLGVPISEGSIYAFEQATSAALEAPYKEIHQAASDAPIRHLDETGWKHNKARGWVWVVAAQMCTLFFLAGSRAREVLTKSFGTVLQDNGINVSDRYRAYLCFPMVRRQICHAHLKRDYRKMKERGGPGAEVGEAALAAHHDIFLLYHRCRTGEINRAVFRQEIKPLKKRLYFALQAGTKLADKEIAGMCRDILAHWLAMWTFVRVAGVEPTNNNAERPIRKVVLWRKGSFGTRSESGCRFVERMLSVTETCRQMERDLLEYVTAAIHARMLGVSAPSLFPG